MKKPLVTILLMLAVSRVLACPICDRQQPKILKGIAHGAGPQSQWDYVIVWTTAFIAIVTLLFAIKWVVKPGEKNPDHIKTVFLNFE